MYEYRRTHTSSFKINEGDLNKGNFTLDEFILWFQFYLSFIFSVLKILIQQNPTLNINAEKLQQKRISRIYRASFSGKKIKKLGENRRSDGLL